MKFKLLYLSKTDITKISYEALVTNSAKLSCMPIKSILKFDEEYKLYFRDYHEKILSY